MIETLIDIVYLAAAALFIFRDETLAVARRTARQGNRLSSHCDAHRRSGNAVCGAHSDACRNVDRRRDWGWARRLAGASGRNDFDAGDGRSAQWVRWPGLYTGSRRGDGAVYRRRFRKKRPPRLSRWMHFDIPIGITVLLSILIGTVTFSGSFIAVGKLSGKISGNPISFPGMRLLTLLLGLGRTGRHCDGGHECRLVSRVHATRFVVRSGRSLHGLSFGHLAGDPYRRRRYARGGCAV